MSTSSCGNTRTGLAARLQEARLAARAGAGIGQEELGDRIGVSQATISDYERGRRRPSLSRLLAIARELDAAPSWLLEGHAPLVGIAGRSGMLSCPLGELLSVTPLPHLGTAGLANAAGTARSAFGGSSLAAEGQAPYGPPHDLATAVVILDRAIAGEAHWAIAYDGPDAGQLCRGDLLLIVDAHAAKPGEPVVWLIRAAPQGTGSSYHLWLATEDDPAPVDPVGRVSRIIRSLDKPR